MSNILGVDLGTNSIGWAIRDPYSETEDQIVDFGTIVFKKGVGEGKSGEYSLAAERRVHRSKRRLYNAKRYRKWATLKVLSENGMCPISNEELRLWSIGNWVEGKNKGRLYPKTPDFVSWLAMDFDRIGKLVSKDVKLKPEFSNIYLLRSYLLKNNVTSDPNGLYKIGRAFYHLVQRRGFKTSRKNGKSNFGENELFKIFRQEHPDKSNWKPSEIYIHIQSCIDKNPALRKERIRNNSVIHRALNEEEFFAICGKQEINEKLANAIHEAIYYVRPLRTQKGLVGKCTLERGKTRIPTSHPSFEEFRALTFINNIKWREVNTNNSYEPIPLETKKKIFKNIFFKKIERGKNKGRIDERGSFDFSEIINSCSEGGKFEFNFKNKPTISSCPFIAGLMNVFADDWNNKFIESDNQYGINWEGLRMVYKKSFNDSIVGEVILNYEGIWHLLFDFIQTKDNEHALFKFCKETLKWNDEKAESFVQIPTSQGYGSLSRCAITKIIPFLQQGYIYSEAVSLANLSTVVGKELFNERKVDLIKSITTIIKKTEIEKKKLNIVNGLIQLYFGEATTNRAKGFNGTNEELQAYQTEVENYIASYFGKESWLNKPETERLEYVREVLDKYLIFLSGKQKREEKASATTNKNPEIDYYKLPRLDIAIKSSLKNEYRICESSLNKLYHPSDIDIYPKAKGMKLEDPNPPSKGWKNPMAMRTMYELRKLINYLLSVGKITKETKIVLEIARELNDSNKRWAIQTWQRYREEENREFAKAIIGVAKEKYPNLNANDTNNIDKIRLWWEQMENGEEIYKSIKSLKEDVEKYRLWKEQGCQCIYTGKIIRLTDLFDGTLFDFEHTLPLSKSFDNSLANLTVCDSEYNRKFKRNRLPANLENFEKESNGYKAIRPRIENWIKKTLFLKEKIEKIKFDTKRALKSGDGDLKIKLIRQKHLLQFEYDYWNKKVEAFSVKEMPIRWKNSQLVDTQIITKYARAYLKSFFNKVDVQKGSVNAEFRKIFGIMGDEKKDRNKHSHHAIDAAVLTLIPSSGRREAILEKYYEAKENKLDFHAKPYTNFSPEHILKIENEILITHISKDQTLTETKKKVRKRGKIARVINENGEAACWINKGDSIRGQLHLESYFGAIKVNERNEDGYVKRENNKFLLKQKNGRDEIWIVAKKAITEIDLDKDVIVDEILKKHLKKQIEAGVVKSDLTDFNSKKIRHVRCRVKAGAGYLSQDRALPIKEHVFTSKHSHKREYLVQNAENYIYLLYEGIDSTGKISRSFRILNLIDVANLKISSVEELKLIEEFEVFHKKRGKENIELKLKKILKNGDRVIFYKEHPDEITKENCSKRVFQIFKFNEPAPGTAWIYLINPMEANPNQKSQKGDKEFNPEIYQARLDFTCDKMNCLFENLDFIITPDGNVKFSK